MKEKLTNAFGALGGIIYFLFSLTVSVMPFIMIDASFWMTFLFFTIEQLFPLATFVFWIWGLVCAIKGVQDIWAFVYYVLFAVMFIPFIWGCISDLIKAKNESRKQFHYKPAKNNESQRKANLFRETIRNEVISSQSNRYPSCEDIIMKQVDSMIGARFNEFDEWESDIDYTRIAIANLYNITFDMAASGQYHVYKGVLTQEGSQLSHICRVTLEKALKNGYITEEEKDDQLSALYENISYIG